GYELGRQAVRTGLGVTDIISVHREVTLSLVSQAATTKECVHIMKASQDLLAECLAPFEFTHRGFIELESLNIKLEAANKELESFSYSVSHDLRAPLRAIDGYARMILKKQGDKFDEDTLRKFNDIRLNARKMGQLIDDLLAFSRLGRKSMSISELNMVDLIRDVWKELNAINPNRKMNLIVNSTPPGHGDAALVRQVYFNLLSNAVKFTKVRDEAQIEVGGGVDGNGSVYYVKDNGVGFEMAYYDKLFGVFQRLHDPDNFEGTGVGLATVKRIINRHGGRVWAEGKVNEGATFYFTLPNTEID
ncbi:MAG TPA: ATP-binding protein, partial [Syntrophales bacterium]|nr:ATP-binding protein [Syntrophales bacterium]